jgi:hypothetical protein
VCSKLSIGTKARSERYLGLPVSVGRSRKRTFEYIKKKIWTRKVGKRNFYQRLVRIFLLKL